MGLPEQFVKSLRLYLRVTALTGIPFRLVAHALGCGYAHQHRLLLQ